MIKYLIDTNVIIKYPSVFETFGNVSVHLKTIEELDRLKDSENYELAYRARKGAKAVQQNLKNIKIERKTYRQKTVDDILLKCAKRKNYTLITNDLTLILKCKFNGVTARKYQNGENIKYTGTVEKEVSNISQVEKLLKEFNGKLFFNQYLIFKQFDNAGECINHQAFIQKEKLIAVENKYINNAINRKIKGKNPEQKCLMNSLFDETIKIIIAGGGYGVGKSFLTINYAFQQLERGIINKIVYVPNNSFVENSREIGALPGSLVEKEIIHMGTICDVIGREEAELRVMEGSLELMPISIARGRNIENSIILVSEAQNLTEEHIKLLIGRVGEGSRIIFDGDIHQSDKPVFKNSNGLKLLFKIRDSEFADLFSTVELQNIERSRTARVSDYLDKID